MKTLQKSTNVTSALKSLVAKIPNGSSWMALQLESQSDSNRVNSEMRRFIGDDLDRVTVVLVKGL